MAAMWSRILKCVSFGKGNILTWDGAKLEQILDQMKIQSIVDFLIVKLYTKLWEEGQKRGNRKQFRGSDRFFFTALTII